MGFGRRFDQSCQNFGFYNPYSAIMRGFRPQVAMSGTQAAFNGSIESNQSYNCTESPQKREPINLHHVS